MKSKNAILHLTAGEPIEAGFARAAAAMKAAKQGKPMKPYFGVSFEAVGEMFAVFTPKRWELIGVLRAGGATTIAEWPHTYGGRRYAFPPYFWIPAPGLHHAGAGFAGMTVI